MSDTALALSLVAVLIPSVILHEIAHGWVADLLGDDTARRAGRISLNPVRHVDPFGTLMLPLMLALVAPFVIGYAKPVPVAMNRLNRPRRDALLVALAGPATNFAIGGLAIIVFRLTRPEQGSKVWLVMAIVAVVNMSPSDCSTCFRFRRSMGLRSDRVRVAGQVATRSGIGSGSTRFLCSWS